jgi:ABC-2 type transport system ATP-binding protein
VIEFSDLTKIYHGASAPAIAQFSLTVRNGSIVGFVGLNGAGKTTTLRTAAGLLLPSTGTVRFDGSDIRREKVEASRTIGFVSEFPNYDPNQAAIEILLDMAAYRGLGSEANRDFCLELLSRVGLAESAKGKFRTFSQGMKKRLALAVSLLGTPRNYLFDEVLNGLDPEGIRYVRNLMQFLKNKGCAVFLSSHILAELQTVADRIAFVHKGRLLQVVVHDDLVRAAGNRLRIVIENVDAKALAFLRTLGEVEQVGSAILVRHSAVSTTDLNLELQSRGYRVAELHAESEDLEAYFFRLIGENP